MNTLDFLINTHRPRKRSKRVGRGIGSGCGKTSSRGHKGFGARSGYNAYYGYEGGQMPLYRKLPTRGFSNARFAQPEYFCCNLDQLHEWFEDGDEVSIVTLIERGILRDQKVRGVKVLGRGVCTRKLRLSVQAVSAGARAALEQAGVAIELVPLK